MIKRLCRAGAGAEMSQRSWCRSDAEPMLCGGYAEQVHVMVQRSWCRGAEVMVQSRCRANVVWRLC